MRSPIVGVVVFLIVVPGIAPGQITPFLIEDSGGPQGSGSSVSGSLVVWMEFINGDFIVRGKDLVDGSTFVIDGANATELDPVTNGSIVVWRDDRDGDFSLYALDLPTGQQRTLVDESHHQVQQAVGENYVVWTDKRNSPPNVPPEFNNHDIYAMDLQIGQEFPVCTTAFSQENPDISGNIIVWSDRRRHNPLLLNPLVSDIYGYDLTTGEEFLIAADPGGARQGEPAISGDIVVWCDGHNGGDIMGHDLSTGVTFPIHVETHDDYTGQSKPDVDGRYVVWVDGRNGVDGDIWGYDLLTGEEFPIYQGPGWQTFPSISGNLVVWKSHPPGEDERIWGAYIPEPASLVVLAIGGVLLVARRRGWRL